MSTSDHHFNRVPMPLIYFKCIDKTKYEVYFSTAIHSQEVQLILDTTHLPEKCSHMDEVCWVYTPSDSQNSHDVFIRCLMMRWGFQGQAPQACAQLAYDAKTSFYLVRV